MFPDCQPRPAAAVKMVIDRYKSYAEEREYAGNIIPNFQIVTPKTGEVFYEYALDGTFPGLFQHFPDSRAVKIFSAPAVIYLIAHFDTILFSLYFFILPPKGVQM